MSQYMTAHPLVLGTQYRLGTHRATYKPSTTCIFIVLVLLLIIVLGIGLVGGINALSDSPFMPFPGGIVILCICLLIVGFILYGIVATYRNRTLRVYVYDYGLIHVGRQFIQSMYWQNVETVWHKVQARTSTDSNGHTSTTYIHTYIVNCIDGTQLKLDGTFARLEQLGKSIEVRTASYLFPGVLKAYQMSQTTVFGPVTVAQQGLYHKAKLLPWTEMKNITIYENQGQIIIKKQGKLFPWAYIKLGDVPNVEVFRMLIQHIRPGAMK